MSFKIEKEVPLAPYGGARFRKYPFNEMKAGDSFLINGDASVEVVRWAATAYGNKHGQKFSVRKTPDGHRCWRVE